jgi:phosphoglycerate dehydrogenase-like enzyme
MKAGKIVITPRGFAKCGIDNVEIMEKAGYEVIYNDTGSAYTKDEFYKITDEAVGIIVGVEQVDRTYIDAHPKLKAAVKFGVGVDNFDLEYCKEKNIFVGRTVGSNSRSVAETAISFVIADSKNLFQSLSETRDHGWSKMTGYEVQGKSIGIIGFGAIGKEVAKMAYGLGMQVFAFDAFGIDKEFASKYEVKEKSVEEIIKTSDFLSLHVPLTEETKNFITLEELKQMKSNAVLINTARGGIVNEADLYEALKSHMIRAAYFDVFTCEPPKAEEPLLQLDNFYLTPHIASRSAEAEKRTADIATRELLEALREK